MLFEAGDIANGQESSKIIIKADNMEDALKYFMELGNIYFRPIEENQIIANADEYIYLNKDNK